MSDRCNCIKKKRIVITGMGVCHPLGLNKYDFWNNLKQGRSSIKKIEDTHVTKTCPDLLDYKKMNVGAFFTSEQLEEITAGFNLKRIDLFSIYAIRAAREAVADAGLENESMDTGVSIGSGIGGLLTIEKTIKEYTENGFRKVPTTMIPMSISDAATGNVAAEFGFHATDSPNTATACTTGASSLKFGYMSILLEDAVNMLCGGAEAASSILGGIGFGNMRAISSSEDPKYACRPFDKERDGFVMGEGSGVIVLEYLESAKERNAKIYGELLSYGASTDAQGPTKPEQDGRYATFAMKQAIERAKISPDKIGYINAHGTSTPDNDKIESKAIIAALGDNAANINISSTKSMHGHCLGATAGLEAIATIMALKEGVIPPTIGIVNPDPECTLDYTPKEAKERKIDYAISNSFGFWGHNVSLLFSRYVE